MKAPREFVMHRKVVVVGAAPAESRRNGNGGILAESVVSDCFLSHARVRVEWFSESDIEESVEKLDESVVSWRRDASYVLVLPRAYHPAVVWREELWRLVQLWFDWARVLVVCRDASLLHPEWVPLGASPARPQVFDVARETTHGSPAAALASYLWALQWLYVPPGRQPQLVQKKAAESSSSLSPVKK
jgi:hypothetical protein